LPHDSTVKNLMDRIFICESLLKRNKIESFLKWLITDEEWITYDNNVRKKSWMQGGKGMTPRKMMLRV